MHCASARQQDEQEGGGEEERGESGLITNRWPVCAVCNAENFVVELIAKIELNCHYLFIYFL
jgi:hypothetical protein